MKEIAEFIANFELLLGELSTKQAQLATTTEDLKVRQIAADQELGDTTIDFNDRVERAVGIQLLQDDRKTQIIEESALSNRVVRAGGEIRSLLRSQIDAKAHARIKEIAAQIARDFIVLKLPFPPNVIAAQHRSLAVWTQLSTSLAVATRPQDDWPAFLVNARTALAAVSA